MMDGAEQWRNHAASLFYIPNGPKQMPHIGRQKYKNQKEEKMTDLERIRSWISTYPATDQLQSLEIDYYVPQRDDGIRPAGLEELSRTENVMGDITVENQYNFGLFYVLASGDGENTDANTEWILGFQQWIQEQSVRRLAPVFGDEPGTERIQACNGALYAGSEDGTVTYVLQLTVQFKKKF